MSRIIVNKNETFIFYHLISQYCVVYEQRHSKLLSFLFYTNKNSKLIEVKPFTEFAVHRGSVVMIQFMILFLWV